MVLSCFPCPPKTAKAIEQFRLLGLFYEFASNILIAEGQALEDAILRTALSKGDARLIVEGDSKLLIDAIMEAF
ncbi:unnamed protein product [Malus baccata var. baccata]